MFKPAELSVIAQCRAANQLGGVSAALTDFIDPSLGCDGIEAEKGG